MRIVIKPAGLAALVVVVLGLLIIIASNRNRGDSAAPAPSATVAAAANTAAPATMPYELDPPDAAGTLRDANFESAYVRIHPYSPVHATLSGQIAAHWYDDSSWATITVDYGRETKGPHGGDACQRIMVKQITSGGICQFAQTLHLVSGRKYTAGLWLRADHPMKVSLLLRQAAQPIQTYGVTDATIGTKWQHVTTTGTIGQDPITYLMLSISETGTVWVDDATLKP